jgi:hypothetical protein
LVNLALEEDPEANKRSYFQLDDNPIDLPGAAHVLKLAPDQMKRNPIK